jgi:hypothetical protein
MPKQKVGDGRFSSPKQSEASRANGSKSKGPKSVAGKSKVAQNATREGLFSRQVVIEQLGEKQSDFDDIKEQLWDVLQPTNALEEMLVQDFLENWWRRERIRRAETAELRTRAGFLDLRTMLNDKDQVEKLRFRFLVLYGEYAKIVASSVPTDVGEIMAELEEVRQELIATAKGADFLLTTIEPLSRTLKKAGTLSAADEVLLRACCGFGSQAATYFTSINASNPKQTKKDSQANAPNFGNDVAVLSKQDPQVLTIMLAFAKASEELRRKEAADTPEPNSTAMPETTDEGENTEAKKKQQENQENKERDRSVMLEAIVVAAIGDLRRRKQLLEVIEGEEAKTATSMTVIDRDISERFARAETAVERRMYRALAALAGMRAVPVSSLLPS